MSPLDAALKAAKEILFVTKTIYDTWQHWNVGAIMYRALVDKTSPPEPSKTEPYERIFDNDPIPPPPPEEPPATKNVLERSAPLLIPAGAVIAGAPGLILRPLNRVTGALGYLVFGPPTQVPGPNNANFRIPGNWTLDKVSAFLNNVYPYVKENKTFLAVIIYIIFQISIFYTNGREHAEDVTGYQFTPALDISIEEAEIIYVYIYNNMNKTTLPKSTEAILKNFRNEDFRRVALMEPSSIRDKLIIAYAQEYKRRVLSK